MPQKESEDKNNKDRHNEFLDFMSTSMRLSDQGRMRIGVGSFVPTIIDALDIFCFDACFFEADDDGDGKELIIKVNMVHSFETISSCRQLRQD